MALAEWTHLDADVDCESEKSTYGLCNVMVVLCWINIRRMIRDWFRGEYKQGRKRYSRMREQMCEIQVRIHRTVLVQPKVLVRLWEALQKVRGNQLIELCETGVEKWILIACDKRGRPEVATDVEVRHPTKQHGRLDEQQKGIRVFWGVINEQVPFGHVLWINWDVSL